MKTQAGARVSLLWAMGMGCCWCLGSGLLHTSCSVGVVMNVGKHVCTCKQPTASPAVFSELADSVKILKHGDVTVPCDTG